jgi:hypothetical protein
MNHHPVPLKSSLLLALVAGLIAGACEKRDGDGDDYTKDCKSVGWKIFSCHNLATPEGSEYTLDCVARGKKVAKADETCGDLWVEAYSCVAALPCEEFNEWRDNHHSLKNDFPCKDEESAFDTECGDLPLWVDK